MCRGAVLDRCNQETGAINLYSVSAKDGNRTLDRSGWICDGRWC